MIIFKMAEIAIFVVQTKSKYRLRFSPVDVLWSSLLGISLLLGAVSSLSACNGGTCYQGLCLNGTCGCFSGWTGKYCDQCSGREKLKALEGLVTDGPGNYSTNRKCSWLIDAGQVGAVVRLQMLHFATECGWDHLYIYDGDSAFSPLLAAYSGLVRLDKEVNSVVEVEAASGSVYVTFYSDVAYNMSGFNISYKIGGCPLNCSGHGICSGTNCSCHSGWIGPGCELALCPNNCSDHGHCNGTQCKCDADYIGEDCSKASGSGVWSTVLKYGQTDDGKSEERASHQAVVIQDEMWVVGGYSFNLEKMKEIIVYSFTKKVWRYVTFQQDVSPQSRHGHSLVVYQKKLYMYGGVMGNNITDELWYFDTDIKVWEQIRNDSWKDIKLAVAGHTAHLVDGIMYVIFGHSPVYGYLPYVQEFHIEERQWLSSKTNGAVVKGMCWHSSVYDDTTRLIFVYGGYHAVSSTTNHLTDELYSFEPSNKKWRILSKSESPRFLHSMVTLGGLMLVFGGNTHNENSATYGVKCFSADFMAYDIACDQWHTLDPPKLQRDVSRFGHTAVTYNGEMYIFGGFRGELLSDILKYTPGICSSYSEELCTQARPGVQCVWTEASNCTEKDHAISHNITYDDYCGSKANTSQICNQLLNCKTCLSNDFDCKWCSNRCYYHSCAKNMVLASQCPVMYSVSCESLHNCALCLLLEKCTWKLKEKRCTYSKTTDMAFPLTSETVDSKLKCGLPCTTYTSCETCTDAHCMWCASAHRCVDMNSYVISFLYGQCTEWTTDKGSCPVTRCDDLRTCEECQENPMCGWCNDKSDTGLGKCMQGGNSGPRMKFMEDNSNLTCSSDRWFFTTCPLCQCNGHSTCINGTDNCQQCQNFTQDSQCQFCQDGYYGNPKNGGLCRACECNNLASVCERFFGKCFCATRGVIGEKCERCDVVEKYYGNPLDGGTCYYILLTDYQFTFNLSKPTDKHYTQINFMNRPTASDKDVDFSVNCSGSAYINITVNSSSDPNEKLLESGRLCMNFKVKFHHKNYNFGESENTTFYVYVYDFRTPFWLQILFVTRQPINIGLFLAIFFSCFLSLLLIAALFWKIKQKYDVYRRRQRMFVELEQMASRPFATVCIGIERKSDGCIAEKKEIPDYRKKKKVNTKPSPIALEPLSGQKAAVLSLLVQLPTGDEEYTANGQSGMAVGSALVSLGNPRKQSSEPNKGDRNKLRKHVHHPHSDACI